MVVVWWRYTYQNGAIDFVRGRGLCVRELEQSIRINGLCVMIEKVYVNEGRVV